MSTIPLSYTINVSLTGTPQGLGEFNTNTVCLFTNEQPLSSAPFIWAVNAQDIVNEYGTDSLTAKMGTALFTPAQNLRTGNGQVMVFPYTATNATSATATTIAITNEIITSLKAVSSGCLTVTIDDTPNFIQGLNFSAISDVNDIVTVLQGKNLDCNISVVNGNQIQFQSRNYGATGSSIALEESSAPVGVDIWGASYLDGTNAVEVAGTDATGTTLAEAYAEAIEKGYFGGMLTTQTCENDAVMANSTALQGQDVVYYEVTQSLQNIGVLGASIKSAGNTKTRLFAYSMNGAEGAKQALATYATIAQSTNYSGSGTALTMNLKELTGVVADTNLNSTIYNLAKTNGVDIYGSTEGLSCVYSFSNGDYTDDATNKLWLKKALEVAGFNYLRKTNTKIPQTEQGVTGLKNAYATVCEQGINNGVIGVGLKWNDSIPFGDAQDFDRNITEKGYYIYSLPVAQQSQAERESRQAPVIQIAIKLSGSIHSSNVIVQIQK